MKIGIKKLFWISAFGAVFILGFYFRVQFIGRNLEYDEIWTLTNYCFKPLSVIFTDLSTPNNHPVYTLLMRYSIQLFGESIFAVRLPTLVSGISVMCITGLLGHLLFKSKFVSILAMGLNSLSAGLTYYSQTARGYELQTLLILLSVLFIVLMERGKITSIIGSISIAIVSILSILTLPTSVLFLFPTFLCHLIYLIIKFNQFSLKSFIKKTLAVLLSYSVTTAFVLIWFICNFEKFKAGQSFGNEVDSVPSLFSFGTRTLILLAPLPFLITSLFSWIKNNKMLFVSYIFLITFPFISAFLTKEGPTRVYLPLIPFILIFSSEGISKIISTAIRNQKLIIALQSLAFIVSLFFMHNIMINNKFKWINPDWTSAVYTTYSNMPPNTYVSLPATSGYPAMFNAPILFKLEEERTPRADRAFLVNLVEGNPASDSKESYQAVFNGIDIKTMNTNNVNLSFDSKTRILDFSSLFGCYGEVYNLKSISSSDNIPKNLFISLFPDKLKPRITISSDFNTILLNLWLRQKGINSQFLTMISENSNLTENQLNEIQEQSKGQVKFYSILPTN